MALSKNRRTRDDRPIESGEAGTKDEKAEKTGIELTENLKDEFA